MARCIEEFVEQRLREDAAYATETGWTGLAHWVDTQWPRVRQHDSCEPDGCVTMRTYAEIWKGHPEYDPEWGRT